MFGDLDANFDNTTFLYFLSNLAYADSTMTTYKGVLEKYQHSGMVKLKLLFHPPFVDYSYLLERTGRFSIGDSVEVTGYLKETRRNYEYSVLFVQSIDKFNLSKDSDTTLITIAGVLHESPIANMTLFAPADLTQPYYIERTGHFEVGDNVVIIGYVKETRRQLRFPLLHVQSIDEFDCCINELRGDINLDGNVNLADLIMFTAYFNNGGWRPLICDESLDINGDSFLNEGDYQHLYDYVLKCAPAPVDCE